MKRLNLIIYLPIILLSFYCLSLLISFIYGHINICENINDDYIDNITDSIEESKENSTSNNKSKKENINYINYFYLTIKSEIVNIRNNFTEMFKTNSKKYSYSPSLLIKNNTFKKYMLEDN